MLEIENKSVELEQKGNFLNITGSWRNGFGTIKSVPSNALKLSKYVREPGTDQIRSRQHICLRAKRGV